MDYLPVFLRLQRQPVVVVGGGSVAARKVTALLKAGAQVTVVAPAVHPLLTARATRRELRHVAAPFSPEHLAHAVAVIAATDDAVVNGAVSRAAQERRIPVNVVDDASLSTFIFPAIIDRSPILVAVSSAGQAPVLARRRSPMKRASAPSLDGSSASICARTRRARTGA